MGKHSKKNLFVLTAIAIVLTGLGVVVNKAEAQSQSTVGCPSCSSTSTSQINASMSNGTGETVWNLYMRPSGQSSWGIDQLGRKTLASNAIWSLGLPGNLGCFWDVRFQYRNGSVRDYPRLDFCTNPGIGLVP